MSNYPIRPEPEAHVLLGVSMGGGAAFAKAMKYRDKFGVAVAFSPPLNLRWISCRGATSTTSTRAAGAAATTSRRGREVVGRLLRRAVKIRLRHVRLPAVRQRQPDDGGSVVAPENPIELLDRSTSSRAFAEFYVAYGGKDQFNIDAQVESFLYRAKQKGHRGHRRLPARRQARRLHGA